MTQADLNTQPLVGYLECHRICIINFILVTIQLKISFLLAAAWAPTSWAPTSRHPHLSCAARGAPDAPTACTPQARQRWASSVAHLSSPRLAQARAISPYPACLRTTSRRLTARRGGAACASVTLLELQLSPASSQNSWMRNSTSTCGLSSRILGTLPGNKWKDRRGVCRCQALRCASGIGRAPNAQRNASQSGLR